MLTRQKIIQEYDALYDETFRVLDDESERTFGTRYTEIHKWRIIKDLTLLPSLGVQSRVLEIGPSIASVLIQRLTGATVEALCIDDLNRNFLDPAGIPLHICDIARENPALAPESYDLILFCEVLEHFALAPRAALGRIVSLTKPGGWIFFSVPNFAKIQNRVRLLRGENPQDTLSPTVEYYAHIREPVYAETRAWWEEAGARVVREGFTNYNREEPGGVLSRLFWTVRFLKIRNWYGLPQVWFPRMREYFYLLLTRRI